MTSLHTTTTTAAPGAPTTPRDAAMGAHAFASDDPAEHFAGYALLGQPFRSGWYLTFRHFPSSSIGPAYRAVWLRTPDRRWTVFADAPPEVSCMRYVGAAVDASVTTAVAIEWTGSHEAVVRVPDVLEWRFTLAETPTTRMLSAVAHAVPGTLWRSDAMLAAMGRMMRPALRAGTMRLRGRTPNAQTFQARPERLWQVADTSATVRGVDAGPVGPLRAAERLADLRMPQRGLFAADLAIRYPSAQ